MHCIRVHRARRSLRCAAALIVLGGASRKASAQAYPTYPQYPGYPQQPVQPAYPGNPGYPAPSGQVGIPPNTGSTTVLPAYRLPVITIAQPVEGVVLPDDKPVSVIRFAAVEPLDPIDALSLTVTVDGTDRTALFTLSQGEAWGRLSPLDETLGAGQHEMRARICSTRGTCAVAKATVSVVASTSLLQQLGASSPSASKSTSRTSKVFGAVLQAMRVLIK
ncbi:hypothetical protein BH11GEM2_BH11GEM2_05710 [soil metagenome]